MDLERLANIGEFLGGLGVIVSLLYLAFQLRGNSRGLRAESYGRSLERVARLQERLSEDAAFARMHNRGLTEPEKLSVEERLHFTWACFEMFGAFEYMHYQHQHGDLPEEIWQRWRETLKFWMSYPGVRRWWHGKPTPFSSGFSALVETCAREGYAPEHPGAWEQWLRSGN